MLEINVPDMDHYHRFITRKLAALDNIAQVKSMFVMNEIIEK
jgi:DNA-binding Lrp family transcriptional regulator